MFIGGGGDKPPLRVKSESAYTVLGVTPGTQQVPDEYPIIVVASFFLLKYARPFKASIKGPIYVKLSQEPTWIPDSLNTHFLDTFHGVGSLLIHLQPAVPNAAFLYLKRASRDAIPLKKNPTARDTTHRRCKGSGCACLYSNQRDRSRIRVAQWQTAHRHPHSLCSVRLFHVLSRPVGQGRSGRGLDSMWREPRVGSRLCERGNRGSAGFSVPPTSHGCGRQQQNSNPRGSFHLSQF